MLRFLPGLVNVARGEMGFAGVPPRSKEEVAAQAGWGTSRPDLHSPQQVGQTFQSARPDAWQCHKRKLESSRYSGGQMGRRPEFCDQPAPLRAAYSNTIASMFAGLL